MCVVLALRDCFLFTTVTVRGGGGTLQSRYGRQGEGCQFCDNMAAYYWLEGRLPATIQLPLKTGVLALAPELGPSPLCVPFP